MKKEVKICPWCGEEFTSYSHLKIHNKNRGDYVNETLPKCQYPGCNNKVSSPRSKTCCKEHSAKLATLLGRNPFSMKNRKLDENGNDILQMKCTESRIKSGNNPFLKENMEYINGIPYNIYCKLKNGKLSGGTKTPNKDVVGYLYVVVSEEYNSIKVGSTNDIKRRFQHLKDCGVKVTKSYEFKCSSEVEARKIEGLISKEFFDNKKLDRNFVNYTEWYDIESLDNILNFINKIV